MTTKTETLYIKTTPLQITELNSLIETGLIQPVPVHVGEFFIKNPDFQWNNGYEKVTHVLPDQIRDDAKKLELILKIGELIHDKIELQKKVELLKCRNKELEKELDSCKSIPMNEGRVIRESIEGQKETIESQKRELESLKWEYQKKCGYADQSKEIDRLKAENEAFFVQLGQEREANNRLHLELEEAKKENLYLKRSFVQDGSAPLEKCIEQAKQLQNLDSKIVKLKANLEQTKADLAQGKSDLEEAKKGGAWSGFKAAKEHKGEK